MEPLIIQGNSNQQIMSELCLQSVVTAQLNLDMSWSLT
jgi:hypothetical protein